MVITVIFMCLLGGVSLTGLILKLTGHDPLDIGGIISFGAGTLALVCGLILLVNCRTARRELQVFCDQQAYIESYQSKGDYDTAAILVKKIELNEWLFGAQFEHEHHRLITFYPAAVEDLRPIE